MEIEIEVIDLIKKRPITRLRNLTSNSTIHDVKKSFESFRPSTYVDRQSYKLDPSGRTLADSDILSGLGLSKGGKLYFKDLGPQIGWTTVFLTEYAGPLLIYLGFYIRPSFIYGEETAVPRALASNIACICWTFHYAKRLLETIFIHRFSHATMPIRNIVKNSVYYWGFAVFVAYFNNHPLYTPPVYGDIQLYAALASFVIFEYGNFSIHVALRNLRPLGSKDRRIPMATSNPMTQLFNFVSCPNYTYEVGSWVAFSVMSQSLPALIFTLAGFGQMTIWAIGKHKNYKKEFSNYPKGRKAILPFIV